MDEEARKREILRRCMRGAGYSVRPETAEMSNVEVGDRVSRNPKITRIADRYDYGTGNYGTVYDMGRSPGDRYWSVRVKWASGHKSSWIPENELRKVVEASRSTQEKRGKKDEWYLVLEKEDKGGNIDERTKDILGHADYRIEKQEEAGHHSRSRPEETFRTLEKKLKGIETPEEFDEVQNWWMREMMQLGPANMRRVEAISQKKYGVPPTTTELFLKVKGESLILYNRGNITLKTTGIPVLFLLKEDEEALGIFRNIVDFIDQKYPSAELWITIGRQPISVAGGEGFRAGIPPKEASVSSMFPYSTEVLHEFEELERRGHPSRVLWATMDFFHELGHTKGISDEVEADFFALKLTKEYLVT